MNNELEFTEAVGLIVMGLAGIMIWGVLGIAVTTVLIEMVERRTEGIFPTPVYLLGLLIYIFLTGLIVYFL